MQAQDKRIRVVHIVEDLRLGGEERTIFTIVSGLNPKKFRVSVWCLTAGGEIFDQLKESGFDAEVLGMRSSRDPFFILSLIYKLRKEKVFVVHAHAYTGATIGRIAAFFAGVPVIFAHVHTTYDEYPRHQLLIERVLSFFSDRIICVSQAVADFVSRAEKVNPLKITVVYNSVQIESLPKVMPLERKPSDEIRVGCIASLFPHKGHRYLLEAFAILNVRYPGKIRLILLGDGVLRSVLEEQARELHIDSIVEFKGQVSQVWDELALFDIVALASSEREGLSIALIEGMSMGKPLVGTRLGGIPEVIQDGENGILVPPKDSNALAEALGKLAMDPGLRFGMGARGRLIAEEKFSSRRMLVTVEGLYESILKSKKLL